MARDEKRELKASGQTFIHIKGMGCDGLERIRRKNKEFQKCRGSFLFFSVSYIGNTKAEKTEILQEDRKKNTIHGRSEPPD